MHTYSDEYIDYWGDVFVENNLAGKNILFECFLDYPVDTLAAVVFCQAMPLGDDEYYPLLYRQKKVQSRIDKHIEAEDIQEEMDNRFERKGHVVEMIGNRNVERFHHYSHPKKWKTNTRRAS